MNYKIKKLLMVLVLLGLTHAVFGKAGESVVKTFYIDGVEVTKPTVDGNGLFWPSDYLTIGTEGTRGYMYNQFLGKIDDFAIYAGAMSKARVEAHYAARTSYSSYCSAVTADAPKLWLKFDDASTANGATATNSGSVTTKNGSYVVTGTGTINKLATGFVAGSGAIEIVGPKGSSGAGSCVDVLDDAGDFSSKLNGDVTVEMWVNYTDSNDYPRFFQHNGVWDNTGGYGISVNDSNQLVLMGGGVLNYASQPNDINNGNWHHIVITYDSNYVTEPLPETLTYADEVASDNPVVWLRFEDAQPVDSAVNGSNHWVGYGSAASIVDKVGGIGKSVYLNGTSEGGVYGVAITNNPNSPPLVDGTYETFGDQYAFCPNDITIEMWYKTLPTGQPQPQAYAPFFQQIGNNEPCAPAVTNASGQIRVFGGSGAGYTGVNPKFDQQWHHLVVTYDEKYLGDPNRMFVRLFLDGVFRDDTNFTGAAARLGPEMSHLIIGAANNIGYTYNAFAGYVDEFAIYSGILSDERIAAHYLAWQPKTCQDMIDRGYGSPMDLNHDCKVNFVDFAEFAVDWMLCNKPSTAGCTSNW